MRPRLRVSDFAHLALNHIDRTTRLVEHRGVAAVLRSKLRTNPLVRAPRFAERLDVPNVLVVRVSAGQTLGQGMVSLLVEQDEGCLQKAQYRGGLPLQGAGGLGLEEGVEE